jgi:hypothetical protein
MSTNRTTRTASWTTAALVLALGLPVIARGQQPLEPVRVVTDPRADELHDRAVALYGNVSKFRQAARLHVMSAEFRAPEDPRAATCLRDAALLTYYSKRREEAGELMERAADRAAARGDVVTAANAYVDAAMIAEELKRPDRHFELGRKGEILMSSPLLSEEQRAALRARITHERQVASAPRP